MPQMSPMHWLINYNIFLMLFLTAMVIVNFINIKFYKKAYSKSSPLNSFKFKW